MPNAEALLLEIEKLRRSVGEKEAKIAVLTEQINWLKKKLFGPGKSEQLDRAQLMLKLAEVNDDLAQAASEQTEKISYERSKKPKVGKHEPPAERFKDLPVEETVVIEPEEVQAEPEAFEKITEEETFEVDIRPPKLFKRRIVRPKYRRKYDRSLPPVIAPAAVRALEGSYASAGLLSWVVLSKYVQHLPLYRQEKASVSWGAPLSRKTMSDWVEQVANWLKPIYNYMRMDLLRGGYVQADETPVRYCDPDHKKGKTEQGWLWLISRPGANVVFDWRLSRRHGEATRLLEGFSGLLQTDAYGAYDQFSTRGEITHLGCMAHARRKFFDALETARREAELVLTIIGQLYACEARYREEGLAPAQRQARRQAEQKRLLKWLKIAIRISQARALPKSALGKACAYALTQWPRLIAYLDHGIAEIDNNLIENAVRPTALGKKNFLFIGHPEAGQRSAIIYSIVLSCQRHGIDPDAYLRDILQRVPAMKNTDDFGPLTPAHWKPKTSTTSRDVIPAQSAA